MNAVPATRLPQDEALLPLVDFKWLMAGVGWWIDVPRMRRDTGYADECIRCALETGSQILCERCAELLLLLADSAHRK
jgi:hypothetical protein